MKKTIFMMLFLALGVQQALAQDFTFDGINYTVTSPTTASVVQNSGITGAITIPAQVTYNGTTLSVTNIGMGAFQNSSSLTSVTIPNSVTSIDQYAFVQCSGLTSIMIPNSVTSIGMEAFGDCSGLTSVTIPNSVTSIGGGVFSGCYGLTSVTIPNSVTSIGDHAFQNCSNLISVTIPNSVMNIGIEAFRGCSHLSSVTIPNSVTSIGGGVFGDCSGLTSVTISNSVTSIVDGAFQYCWGLTSVTIPNSVTNIGANAFYHCSGLTSVTIPNSVTSIGSNAFAFCSGLSSVTIPNSVTSIGMEAFQGCSGLTSVTIPNSITSIGDRTFYGCSGLTSLPIGNSVTSIGVNAFMGCTSVTSVTIPSSVTSIGDGAIGYCTNLTSVTIPNSVTNIGQYAFYGCSSLTSLICNIANPLSINPNVFNDVNQSACTLIVPSISLVAYQAAAVWQNFIIYFPTSKVTANLCGATLSSLNANINADYVAGYQQYRFEVTNGNVVNTIELNKYNFSLTQMPGITYNTTYGVRVAVKIGGNWGEYGVSCNVTTPALSSSTVISTKINPVFCDATLITLDTKIGATPVTNATGYSFLISTGGIITVYNSPVYNFRLSDAVVATYGTTYTIRAAAQVNGVYGNFGSSCNITTPTLTSSVVPTTALLPAVCGANLTTLTTKIGAIPVYGATGYRFEIKFGTITAIYDSTVYNFKLAQAGVAAYSTNYSIRVAAQVNGVYGNYGASCTVTTPVEPIQYTTIPDADFEARLISLGLDSGAIDHKVPTSNITSVTELNVADSTISDLTGIRDFTSLQNLNCFNSNITSLNVSGLTNLQNINSYQDYFLTTVILTGCTALNYINFSGCSSLTSITIPNSVQNIGANAFYNCSALTSVSIPHSVTSIGNGAFYNCTGLTSVTIPNSVMNIGTNAFEHCSGLTSVTIPNSVTSIGNSAFNGCSGLTSVTIPNSITSIGDRTFYGCSGLTSLPIGNSVTSIGVNAFMGCTSVTSVTIPSSVTSIGDGGFGYCTNLTSVTIPNSVTNIGQYAFYGCSSLTSLICNIANPLSINPNVFNDVNQSACSLIVPASSLMAYQAAAVWQNFMIHTPTSKVTANLCGATLSSLNANINADYIVGYQAYRFEVTNGNVVNTIEVNKYNFSLTQTPGITYGTTYGVRVAVKMDGTWGEYGVICYVTTPALSSSTVISTKINPVFCGTSLAAMDTKIATVPVYGATGYRFEIVRGGVSTVYNSNLYLFRLADAGVAAYGTTYTIRVAAFVGGVWGNYGAACTVTSPSSTSPPNMGGIDGGFPSESPVGSNGGVGTSSGPALARLKAKTFEVSAYPNPFETAFNLSLETPSKEDVTVAVYDMMGKLIETHQVNPMEVANLAIGSNFAAGIYNVIVSQANEGKTIRLIRK